MSGAELGLRARRRARGGGPAVRGRHGRGGPAADLGPARRVRASSIRTARSRAGSAAAAPSPSSSARRSGRSSTASPACSACRRTAPAEGRRGDGVVELVMTCHSGGTLEIYVEPHLPAPSLWIAGTTPIAGALAALGAAAGWRVTVIDPIADADAFPDAERVSMRRPTSRGLDPDASPYVVVATPGHLGRGGAGRRAAPRRVVRRPRRLADAGRRRPRRGCARRRRARRSGSPPCAPRPGSTSAPRRPRRSPSRSWPSSSRSAAAGRRSSPRPARRRSPAGAPAGRVALRARSSTTSSCSTRSAG